MNNKTFKCNYCPKEYDFKESLDKHLTRDCENQTIVRGLPEDWPKLKRKRTISKAGTPDALSVCNKTFQDKKPRAKILKINSKSLPKTKYIVDEDDKDDRAKRELALQEREFFGRANDDDPTIPHRDMSILPVLSKSDDDDDLDSDDKATVAAPQKTVLHEQHSGLI
jgi:hypothetical protein